MSEPATPAPPRETEPAPAAAERRDPLIGTVLGERYRILDILGRGGMGAVYKAQHVHLQTLFAVKVLLSRDGTVSERRFFHEARLAGQVRHPNTVFVSDFGLLPDGRPYLAMEYLAGRTLNRLLKDGPLPPRRACLIALQVVRGVRAIHKQGILHRDLKPHNVVLLTQDDGTETAKIVDFGIAKNLHLPFHAEELRAAAATRTTPDLSPGVSTQLTRMGEIVGTPAYLSPEQVTGEDLDGRSDQYALGCMLYAMLVGEPPFSHANRVELMLMRLSVKPQPPRVRRPDAAISERLDALVMRCLAVDRSDRFPRMRDLEAALEEELGLSHAPSVPSVPPVGAVTDSASGSVTRRGATSPTLRRRARTGRVRSVRRLWVRMRRYAAPVAGILSCLVIVLLYLILRGPQATEGPLSEPELLQAQRRAVELLTEQLQAPAPEVRARALAALGDTRDVRVYEPVKARLRDGEQAVVAPAARALGGLGDRRALPALAFALSDARTAVVRVAAADALRRLGDDSGTAALRAAWTGPDEDARLLSALALCPSDAAAAALVRRALPGIKEPLLGDALGCLAARGDEPAVQRLRAPLESGQPLPERLLTLGRLLSLGLVPQAERPAAAAQLRKAAQDTREAVGTRLVALDGIGLCGEPRVDGRWLLRLLGAPDARLRVASAGALVRLIRGEPALLGETAQAWARAAIDDPQLRVRETALEVLRRGKPEVAAAALARALRDHESEVRLAALGTLDARLGPAAAQLLAAALASPDTTERQAALRAITRLAHEANPKTNPGLLGLRGAIAARTEPKPAAGAPGQPDAEALLARGALLAFGDTEQLGPLRGLVDDPRAELRLLAVEQLAQDEAGLVAFLTDVSLAVRFAAALRLARHGDARATPVLAEGLVQRGEGAALALGGLLQLGGAAPAELPVAELATALRGTEPGERQALVRLCAELPPEAAVRLLSLGVRDPDAAVRTQAVEVLEARAEALGPVAATLALQLEGDEDGAVRARAAMLLSRLAAVPPAQPGPAPAPAAAPSPPPADAAAGADGRLVLRTPRPLWIQIDAQPWQKSDDKPVPLPAGSHHLRTLGQELEVTVAPGQPVTLTLDESSPERLLRLGEGAAGRKEMPAAQQQLTGARAACPVDARRAGACLPIAIGATVRLAQLFEALDRLGEAMTEYQTALQLALSAPPRSPLPQPLIDAAQAGARRLSERVGLALFPVTAGKPPRCTLALGWLPPGAHQILVHGKRQRVLIRARESLTLGVCP